MDASMASTFEILDGVQEKNKGMGAIICLFERIVYLRDNLLALTIKFM